MMAYTWLGVVVLLLGHITKVDLCDIPDGNNRLVRSLNLKLLRTTLDTSVDPNPSIYIGLRLSEDHSLQRESDYLQRLKTQLQSIISGLKSVKQEQPSTGIIALYLMALKSSCEDMEKPDIMRLITRLKHLLHEEKKQIDTEAMAGMAFLCLKNSSLYSPTLTSEVEQAISSVKEKILKSQNKDGSFGNIYSTPLAVQFLSAFRTLKDSEECPKATNALLESMKQGKFSNPMMMSQLMPVLHHKSYLDIADVQCINNEDNLFVSPNTVVVPDVAVGERVSIRIIVQLPSNQPFTTSIEVPSRSSLLDILNVAEKQNANFTFKTKNTLYGPFLTTVNGVTASSEERTYWQLLKDPNTPLEEGVADYKPEDGEIIILRLSKFA
ncbi:hypothetical protein GDO86_002116 [Hymenochirus boettgeri]|uniref:Transcobalamin-2 n=1 Tax=Hymenochirus boettgeri TaxID=247094 RepID=A0A8T2KL71_9PIPI|nr:hypothetical protein GDO86_002116 [Hymenochirus boettgeri]